MAENINFSLAERAGEQVRATMQSSALSRTSSNRIGHWTVGSRHDGEPGNPCIGIAIGCVLSLPIWLGLVVLYRLWA